MVEACVLTGRRKGKEFGTNLRKEGDSVTKIQNGTF
jgi:hypothetical protein